MNKCTVLRSREQYQSCPVPRSVREGSGSEREGGAVPSEATGRDSKQGSRHQHSAATARSLGLEFLQVQPRAEMTLLCPRDFVGSRVSPGLSRPAWPGPIVVHFQNDTRFQTDKRRVLQQRLVRERRCAGTPMCGNADVQERRCAGTPMCRSADVQERLLYGRAPPPGRFVLLKPGKLA